MKHIRRQNRKAISTQALRLAAFVVLLAGPVACGLGNNDRVKVGTGGPGGSPNKPVATKPLPTLGEADFGMSAMDELMRFRRVASKLIAKPTSGSDFKEGCLEYDTKDTSVRYLSVNYHDCKWTSLAKDDGKDIAWTLTGEERFVANTDSSSAATANLVLIGLRMPSKVLAVNTRYVRTAKSTPITPGSGSFSFVGDSTLGDAKDNKNTLVTSHLETRWLEAAGSIRIPVGRGELKFAVRPANSADKPLDTTTYTLSPTTDILFDGDGFCLRPLGTFSWTKTVSDKVTASGILISSKDGLHTGTGADAKSSPWSTCLEMSPL